MYPRRRSIFRILSSIWGSLKHIRIFGLSLLTFLFILLIKRLLKTTHSFEEDVQQCCSVFSKPFSDERFQCNLAFDEVYKDYIANKSEDRLPLNDIPFMSTNCSDIKQRRYFSNVAVSEEEEKFPIAIVRLVYKDYFLQEMMLSVQYQPQNIYCYSIDYKAGLQFSDRIRQLASCFPNVFVAEKQRILTSLGHQMYAAQLDCLEIIRDYHWTYVQLLQNNDVPLKTNLEMVRILKMLNGANDVGTRKFPGTRMINSQGWTLANLNLFKDNTRNFDSIRGTSPIFNFSKSVPQTSLTKGFVNFMFDDINIREIAQRIEDEGAYGFDELLYSSLNSMTNVRVPGGFTTKCLEAGIEVGNVARYSLWNKTGCESIRHGMCMLEITHLPMLIRLPHMYANKFMQDYDLRAPACLLELIYNRTFLEKDVNRLDEQYYQNLPHVKYQTLRRKEPINVDELCKSN